MSGLRGMKNSVKQERRNRGLTQEGLANSLNVSRQTVISIESCRYVPSTVLTLKIAEILERKVEELFTLDESDR